METLLYISASIALLALAGLFIYLIRFIGGVKGLLGTVTTAVDGVVGEIGAIRTNLQGTIKNIEGITGKVEGTVDRLNDSMERVNSQLDQVEGIVESVKVMTEDVSRLTTDATDVVHEAKNVVVGVIGLVDNVQSSVQRPVNEVMTIFSALGKGIRKFRMKLGGAESNGGASAMSRRELPDGMVGPEEPFFAGVSSEEVSISADGTTETTVVTQTTVFADSAGR